jgi:hypothetical protein
MNANQNGDSQKRHPASDALGTGSRALADDRRNLPVWVPNLPDYGGDLPLLLGFDGEWKTKGQANDILSYQYFALDFKGGCWRGIFFPKKERFGLAEILACVVLEGLAAKHITRWPTAIYFIAHFTLADLTTLASFPELKSLFDAVRRTFVTIKDAVTCRLWDLNRHRHDVELTLRDTMLLAPGGKQSLADLGGLVGCPKLELTDVEIENMDALLVSNPGRFEAYAQRDPEICVRYAARMLELNYQITGKPEIPPTLSSLGVNYLLKCWEELGIDQHAVLGTEVVKESPWSERLQRPVRRREDVPVDERYLYESFAVECYHGGRSEQYAFGAGQVSTWTDWDLRGAYTTAMTLIGMPDWKSIRQSRDVDDFQPSTLGFARVRFRFPPGTRFPVLPVRTANGLIFPLEGESYCCAPELHGALRLGAQIEVVDGIMLPASFHMRPFEAFVIACAKRRKEHEKGSLRELFWKEVGNGTYGKTAQGLRRKRVFDPRVGQHVDLPPSRITNPFFAAFTTSFVRAALGEILASLPLNRVVFSATTDGFLTDATDDEVMAATDGPLCRLFAHARLRICGDITVVERKNRIAQPLGWRTRGQATLQPIEGETPVLARAGLKPPVKDPAHHNQWIVEMFVNRTAESKQTIRTLRSFPEVWRDGGDLVPKEIVRRIRMDYDFKRRPVNPSVRPINGIDHLCFDTVPWRSVQEFQACREAWDAFAAKTGAVLKTPDDLARFEDFSAVSVAKTGLRRSRRDTTASLAKRMFLRAYTRSAWGLDARSLSYAGLARWLTENGYRTSKADVENARRPNAKLVEHVVPDTPAVQKFVALVLARFPAFQTAKLLSSSLTSTGSPK